jgi:hypothetical protein
MWNMYDEIKKSNFQMDGMEDSKRVEILERKNNQKNYVINQARLNTSPCSIPDLNSPKECYIDSNYECKWSVEADRCNLTDQ